MSSDINYNQLLANYNTMSSSVNEKVTEIGGMTAASVQMSALFQLQMRMNTLSMFGQTITNVIQGIQDVATSIVRNIKG